MKATILTVVLTFALAIEATAAQKPQPAPMPPVKTRFPGVEWSYGQAKFGWEGVAVVADPVNKETLYLCGRNGGADFGSIGSWALAEDGKTWREMTFTSPTLDRLRKKCQDVRALARLGESAARRIFYDALEPDKEAEAAKGTLWKRLAEALNLGVRLVEDLDAAKPQGAEADAIAHAKQLVLDALTGLHAAEDKNGKLDAALIKNCFDAQWALDEAADALANSPGPRYGAAAAYDPERKAVVLFGGSHGDYVLSDTWLYDCSKKTWRQLWPKSVPPPRTGASLKWNDEKKTLELSGGQTILNKMVYQQGYMPAPAGLWTFDAAKAEWTSASDPPAQGVAPATRVYRTIVSAYDPRWYDAAPRGDTKPTAEWLDKLKPNTWTEVPIPERPCPERDWGGAAFNPDRDEIYRWTGGHQADPSDIVSTYHPAINRYSIGYVASISGKGMSFDGRPDCMNHTYLQMAYDPLAKRLICLSMGGTGVYDPDRMDFEVSLNQPFNRHIYLTCVVGTPKGAVVWTPGFFGVLDVKEKAWKKLPVKGALPRSETDGSTIAYDSKRDAIWFGSFTGYQKPSGQVWRYDMKSTEVQAMNPAGQQTIGVARGFASEIRESVYLPKSDLVLFNNFVGGRQAAYDPVKNRWVLLNIPQNLNGLGSVSVGMIYDARRDLIWAMLSYKRVCVLRIDPKALTMTEELPK